MTVSGRLVAALLCAAVVPAVPSASGGELRSRRLGGVVVEKVAPGSASERAGIREGDVVLSWKRAADPPANPEPAAGDLVTPIDLTVAEVEQAPRAPYLSSPATAFVFEVEREASWREVPMGPGEWGLSARPRLSGSDLENWTVGRGLWLAAGNEKPERGGAEIRFELLDGLARWDELGSSLAAAGRRAESAWVRFRIAHALADAGEVEAGLLESRRLVAEATAARDWSLVARSWSAWEARHWSRREVEPGEMASICTLEARMEAPQPTLAAAASLHSLGMLAFRRGDLADGKRYFRRSLVIRQRLAPGSLVEAHSLNNLGLAAEYEGDLVAAEDAFLRVLATLRRLAPGGENVAGALNNLSLVATDRGDLAAAESFLREALEIRAKLEPEGVGVAQSLANLASVMTNRGEFAAAEEILRRALAIRENLDRGSVDHARVLNNLGVVISRRGDQETAAEFYRRGLAIKQALAPDSLDAAAGFNNLGEIELSAGRLDSAEESLLRALALAERSAPGTTQAASILYNLAKLARERGDPAGAEQWQRRSLQIYDGRSRGLATQGRDRFVDPGLVVGVEHVPEFRLDLGKTLQLVRGLLGRGGRTLARGLDHFLRIRNHGPHVIHARAEPVLDLGANAVRSLA